MLAASMDGFLLFWQTCYELTSVLFLCFFCLMQLLFVANKLFFLLSFILLSDENILTISSPVSRH